MEHIWVEWDEGWFALIFAFGVGVILLGLVFGCIGLYRLKQRLERRRT